MGFKISWLAFEATSRDEALAATGLRWTVKPDEYNETRYSGAETADRFLLWVNDCEYAMPTRLAALSQGRIVLGCQIHEGTMFSSARLFSDGVEQWAIVHDAQENARDLHATGDLPTVYEAIRKRLMAEQDEADAEGGGVDFVFDIPLETAQAICGFKHDVSRDDGGLEFFALDGEMSKPRSVVRRLFG